MIVHLTLCVLCLFASLYANVAIRIDSPRDYAILERFFKFALFSQEYGYVLEGTKPISVRNFAALDRFPTHKFPEIAEEEFNHSLLVREAFPVWERLCSHQNKFVLKRVTLTDGGLETSFINVAKLEEVIEKNITLFKYILGPMVTAVKMKDEIVKSDRPLTDILQNNLTLMGIVLGYGSHNSIVGGRDETIYALSISKDTAPFTPQSSLMQENGTHSWELFTPDRYGWYYLELAGGDDSYFRKDLPALHPSVGFANLNEELHALEELEEPLPPSLREKPMFVFGSYKGGQPNQPFFKLLQKTQSKIRTTLHKSHFLEYVLERISGKKPLIRVKKAHTSLTLGENENWEQTLLKVASRFKDEAQRLAFIQSFCDPNALSLEPPEMIFASATKLEGLKIARQNLDEANRHFNNLRLDSTLAEITPKQLYFKSTSPGSGERLEGARRVRVEYVIEDLKNNILFAHHDIWLSISQTIPGFAHGIQGMKVGERRLIFVHPALGYGSCTSLPPCTGLIIKVRLLDVDNSREEKLPPLTPIDMSWIQDSSLYRRLEESLSQQPRFCGAFYRHQLDKINSLEMVPLITELKRYLGHCGSDSGTDSRTVEIDER